MPVSLYQLKITLRHIRPLIWRRLTVPSTATLADLHVLLQIAFGWTDSHLHQFVVGRDVIDERKVRLDKIARAKSKLVYEYDFGDGWQHDVVVERVEPATASAVAPICVAGRRAGPPEDCGGPWGYGELVAVLARPKHPEHAERRAWVGPHWRPEELDLDFINKQLRLFHARTSRRSARPRRSQAASTRSQ